MSVVNNHRRPTSIHTHLQGSHGDECLRAESGQNDISFIAAAAEEAADWILHLKLNAREVLLIDKAWANIGPGPV